MPLGFERINERTQRPNALINFIKPLPGPTAETAALFLSRVAAICYPFMKTNRILVQALEEFPPNNEFVGRNFNAGEVIQLVLKDRQGRWLSLRYVEMVMVHELAHCKEMNHSKAFWKVRDAYAVDLRGLWGRGYTGEGMWGPGRHLLDGEIENAGGEERDVPEHLCGGTYGRRKKRGRAKKEKEKVSYAERKQRRILKKFGEGGKALGDDEGTRVKLEGGVARKGKPRVAGSARGRELRAAAALARFEPVKKEEIKEDVSIKIEDSDSDTEDEYDDVDNAHAAVDVDGTKMTDEKGHSLVKICEGEDDDDGDARREMDELHDMSDRKSASKESNFSSERRAPMKPTSKTSGITKSDGKGSRLQPRNPATPSPNPQKLECPICSLANDSAALTCVVCSNVLNTSLVTDHWRCQSNACQGSRFINAGDAGMCGACGSARRV
ncbi:WLM-domain-containing protein [Mytilinidion resinicola]|uniref:WLM-domain-containing protein n=1 Tax=Mytilinidion resinicola TaxID=574789 RepID=A0A6A6Z4U9_9PEZI|nr:WLM-domain-containing protein [Mytilinidion resinicola]KAF2815314.1 WLM-domain-containing protein [Mytilinidion resinicola]